MEQYLHAVIDLGCELVKKDVASFRLLRSVHRRIGMLEQERWGVAIFRVQGNANTGSHCDRGSLECAPGGDGLDYFRRNRGHISLFFDFLHEAHEFVSPVATDGIHGSERGFQPPGDHAEHRVSNLMPV